MASSLSYSRLNLTDRPRSKGPLPDLCHVSGAFEACGAVRLRGGIPYPPADSLVETQRRGSALQEAQPLAAISNLSIVSSVTLSPQVQSPVLACKRMYCASDIGAKGDDRLGWAIFKHANSGKQNFQIHFQFLTSKNSCYD